MSALLNNIVVVVHNVSSVHRVVEFTRLVTSLGFKYIVFSKLTGAAAQQGVPEAFRIAVKQGSTVLILGDLPDLADLVRPEKTYFLLSEREPTRQCAKLHEVLSEMYGLASQGKKVALVVNGSDLPFTPKELQLGVPVQVFETSVPSTAVLAVTLYELLKKTQSQTGQTS